MKKLLMLITVLVLAFTLAACGNDADTDDFVESDGDFSVKLSIDFPDDSGKTDVKDVIIYTEADDTVLDALEEYADDNGIRLAVDQSSTPYVTAIDGVAATDKAGWVYEINGEMVMEAAGQKLVEADKSYEWKFTTW